jgi:small subunit ribosomal protein S21
MPRLIYRRYLDTKWTKSNSQRRQLGPCVKKFKKKIAESGVIDHLREREFYTKPTTERKLKASAARARWNKKLRDQALPPKLY